MQIHTVVVVLVTVLICARSEFETKPCCFPYKFQAVVAPLPHFKRSDIDKVVTVLHRDWVRRLQVQDTVSYNSSGLGPVLSRLYMDYNTNYSYFIQNEKCKRSVITSAMLEPCMPDDAEFLGQYHVGSDLNEMTVQTFFFRRTNYNRNIEMTVSVTSDRCVPVMETIQGTIGEAKVNTLVMFTNFTREVDETAFDLPQFCKITSG